jgi:hypothetical protein
MDANWVRDVALNVWDYTFGDLLTELQTALRPQRSSGGPRAAAGSQFLASADDEDDDEPPAAAVGRAGAAAAAVPAAKLLSLHDVQTKGVALDNVIKQWLRLHPDTFSDVSFVVGPDGHTQTFRGHRVRTHTHAVARALFFFFIDPPLSSARVRSSDHRRCGLRAAQC